MLPTTRAPLKWFVAVQSPGFHLTLCAFRLFAVLLLPCCCTFILVQNPFLTFFFLSVTPELWHFKGSAAEEPVADFLRRSLDWAMPPIWLYLGPSGKTIWGCHASPSVKGKDKCSDKHHENIQESQQACINPNFISISIFIGGHRAVLMGFGCRFKQPKGTKNSD